MYINMGKALFQNTTYEFGIHIASPDLQKSSPNSLHLEMKVVAGGSVVVGLYMLAISKVTSGCAPTCDSVHS